MNNTALKPTNETREIIPITSEEQWLGLRHMDVTSTMVAGLFDLSPYVTLYEIYQAKKNNIHVPFQATERMSKGKKVEQFIAEAVAEKLGAVARPNNNYIRIPGENLASSFDWELVFPDGEIVNLEIKAVDTYVYKNQWTEDEAPEHIEIQVQTEMEVADRYERTIIAACTGIYDFHLIERARDREFGAAIRAANKKFWHDVAEGNEPQPNWYRDADVIAEMYRNASGAHDIDLTNDQDFEALLSKYERLGKEEKQATEDRAAVKAEIHYRIANGTGAYTERYKLTAGWTKDSPGKVITQDMVGTVTGARKGHRQCLVKNLMEKTS